jgi:hypothetical protein
MIHRRLDFRESPLMLLACQPAGLKEKEGSLWSLLAQTAFLFTTFTQQHCAATASLWR